MSNNAEYSYRAGPIAQHKKKKKKGYWTGNPNRWPANVKRPVDVWKERAARERENQIQIRASLYSPNVGGPPNEKPLPYNRRFLVIHFNTYGGLYTEIAAEFCIAAFSIRDGLEQCYSRLLDPGEVPSGQYFDFTQSTRQNMCPMPPFDPEFSYEKHFVEPLEKFMRQYPSNPELGGPAFLYTLRSEFKTTEACLQYIIKKTGHEIKYELMPITVLIQTLLNEAVLLRELNNYEVGKGEHDGFVEEQFERLLGMHKYTYLPDIACNYHVQRTNRDAAQYCSMNIVKRWIYHMMPIASRFYGVLNYLHTHIPLYERTKIFTRSKKISDDEVLDQHEIPAEVLPRGVKLIDVYNLEFKKRSSEGPSEADSSNPEPAKPYGTYQMFPNLCDLKEIYDKDMRAIYLKDLPVLDGKPAPYVERERARHEERLESMLNFPVRHPRPLVLEFPDLESYDPFGDGAKSKSSKKEKQRWPVQTLAEDQATDVIQSEPEPPIFESLSRPEASAKPITVQKLPKAESELEKETAEEVPRTSEHFQRTAAASFKPSRRLGMGRGISTRNPFLETQFPGLYSKVQDEAVDKDKGMQEFKKQFYDEFVHKKAEDL